MSKTEWWQRGPVHGIAPVLQPVAHILLQVRDSTHELIDAQSLDAWNARPGGVASAAFHVRQITGVIDRLFTYARDAALSQPQLPSTVIGCLVHGAEHAMRHVGQLSVTLRVVRDHT